MLDAVVVNLIVWTFNVADRAVFRTSARQQALQLSSGQHSCASWLVLISIIKYKVYGIRYNYFGCHWKRPSIIAWS